jgi:urease accessory protein
MLKVTTQTMDVVISEESTLILLPDPVTCFRSASYNQSQTFRLSRDAASLVVLDWVTSGRVALGEEWAFSRYYSANHVWVEGKRIVKDVMLLEDPETDMKPLARRTLFDRLSPYSCYATLILYGPVVKNVIREMTERYEAITVFKTTVPAALIWSLSSISDGAGCVVRVAGKETECVREWFGHALRELESVIGIDVYRKAFP